MGFLGAFFLVASIAHPVVVRERYVSEARAIENLDSLAVWHGGSERTWVLGTAKTTHRLLVYDAGTGNLLRVVGGPGPALGRFQRPNGIAVVRDLAVVVERDNRRLQILRLPGFEPLGAFGEEHLERPYGLAVVPLESAVDVFVTDNFEAEPGKALSPERLAERVEHFHFSVENGALASERIGAFGEASGKGVLTKVESIGADGARKIVLVADEDPAQLRYKIYDTSGNYRSSLGQGLFRVEPEGIALYDCGESGLWVAVDQDERLTRFHLFDREGLEHLGSFTGAATGNTDGIALTSRSFRDFPRGALFAVDDDQAISAFDWAQIEAGLGLESRCGGSQQ